MYWPRSSVVVVGSLLSITGFPGYSPYTPTKYALKGLVDGLDIEYRPFNIFFQLAIPADVDTPMYAEVKAYLNARIGAYLFECIAGEPN